MGSSRAGEGPSRAEHVRAQAEHRMPKLSTSWLKLSQPKTSKCAQADHWTSPVMIFSTKLFASSFIVMAPLLIFVAKLVMMATYSL